MTDWNGRRVVIVGAARQGTALAKHLALRGAQVTLTDRRPAQELQAARQALAEVPIRWVLGGHPLELLEDADLLCLSGGVPPTLPLAAEARRRGIPLSNDSQIFLEEAPCKVIGVTGSAGKTTTTVLVGRMASAAQAPAATGASQAGTPSLEGSSPAGVWVGGNVGTPLITFVDEMKANDLAVMELSSFQLELMTRSPAVAAVLNISPNHLDRHGTMQAYAAIKARILEFQSSRDAAVLNLEDTGAWELAGKVRGELLAFGFREPAEQRAGAFLAPDGEAIVLCQRGKGGMQTVEVMPRREVALRGEHNLSNVLAACAIGAAARLPSEALRAGVRGFGGVPHRLEYVRTWGGADWYNDSIATAPERAIAAIRSFDEPLVLLAGGRDKDLPWEDFAELVNRRVKRLVLFGEAAGKIERAVRQAAGERKTDVFRCENLRQAIQAAAALVTPGEVVLLSPGGASFDEFRDFEDRGEAYRKWVMELP